MDRRRSSGSGSVARGPEQPQDRAFTHFMTLIKDPAFLSNVAAMRKVTAPGRDINGAGRLLFSPYLYPALPCGMCLCHSVCVPACWAV